VRIGSSDIVGVLGWARTPFGKFGGTLRDVKLPVLGAVPVAEALRRSQLSEADVDEVVIGVNFPGSERSVARQVALRAGLPENLASYTVDRACCSSLTAISLAARGIRLGDTDVAIAGGVDNPSRVPYFLEDLRFGNRLGNVHLVDQLVITCPHTGVARAIQASDEAQRYGVDRQSQDEWAFRSQQLYNDALEAGFINPQLVSVAVDGPGDASILLDRDEAPRPATTYEMLSALPTVNGSSTVTAGNAPNMSSGASALVLCDVDRLPVSTSPRVTLEGWSMVSGPPGNIASIPAEAARRCLSRANVRLESVSVIEINEAFAAVPLVTALALSDGDPIGAAATLDRTNLEGGAIAVGHPTGATACRLVMSTIEQLIRRGGGIGLVAICGGVGEAEAVLVRVG
jgi:acetyl-CoA C-acetyltransferase